MILWSSDKMGLISNITSRSYILTEDKYFVLIKSEHD